MGSTEAVKNVLAVLKAAIAKIPKQWSNVQAVYLKTSDSAALPILQLLPDDLSGKIDGAVDGATEDSMEAEEAEEPPKKAATPQKKLVKKSATRPGSASAKKTKAK